LMAAASSYDATAELLCSSRADSALSAALRHRYRC
jgi:hypothetical protein